MKKLTVIEKKVPTRDTLEVQVDGAGYPVELSGAETAFVEKMLASGEKAIFLDVLEKVATAGFRRHKAVLEDEHQ